MKKILIVLVAILWIWVVVYWFQGWFKGKPEVEVVETEVEKQSFFIQTSSYNDLKDWATIKKTGKINSTQDIKLSANAAGRVSYVSVKPGQKVFVGQVLAQLEDNIWSYWINISRASNGVERAQINYDSTKINLDKAVFDAELNLEKLERNLENLEKDSEQTLLQAKDNLNNNQYWNLDSSSALRLQQLDNTIEKAKLDYEIKIRTDQEIVSSYRSSLIKEYNGLLILLDDTIEFSDIILWVTDKNKDKNDDYDRFLWAKDSSQKNTSKQTLREIMSYRGSDIFLDLQSELQSQTISEERIIEIIDIINNWYESIKILLNNMESTINNSIQSAGTLWSPEINAFIASINWYQSQLQGSYAWFLAFWSQVKSFLRTYEDNQASILKSIALQEQDRDIQFRNLSSSELNAETSYERTLLSIEDNLKNLQDQIKTAKNNLNNAIQTRSVTLRSLNNSIEEAQISYTSSAREYNKLTITSPINGTISDVLIDAWEEVSQWNMLFDIVSDSTPEIQISFSATERELVEAGQKVFMDIWRDRITGTIYSLSEVADENLNYKSTIIFKWDTRLIWNLVNVEVPIKTSKMLVPINIVSTQWWEIGLVKTLSGSTFSDVRVRMWEVFGEYVEIESCAKNCEDLNIITSDVSNFDENKFVIIEK